MWSSGCNLQKSSSCQRTGSRCFLPGSSTARAPDPRSSAGACSARVLPASPIVAHNGSKQGSITSPAARPWPSVAARAACKAPPACAMLALPPLLRSRRTAMLRAARLAAAPYPTKGSVRELFSKLLWSEERLPFKLSKECADQVVAALLQREPQAAIQPEDVSAVYVQRPPAHVAVRFVDGGDRCFWVVRGHGSEKTVAYVSFEKVRQTDWPGARGATAAQIPVKAHCVGAGRDLATSCCEAVARRLATQSCTACLPFAAQAVKILLVS